jgi:hypothetical protein
MLDGFNESEGENGKIYTSQPQSQSTDEQGKAKLARPPITITTGKGNSFP